MGFKPIHIFLIPPFKSCKLLNCSTLFQRGKKSSYTVNWNFLDQSGSDFSYCSYPDPTKKCEKWDSVCFGQIRICDTKYEKRKQNSLKTYLQNKLKIIYDRINNMTCHATPFMLEHLQRTVITNIINMIYWLCTNLQS